MPRTTRTARGVAQDWVAQLRPLDPLTLADLPGYSPIPVGARRVTALNPTGHSLALFISDEIRGVPMTGTPRRSTLQLLDLPNWRLRATPIVVAGEIAWSSFAPDGRTLYWLSFDGGEEVATQQRAYTLYRYRLGAGQAEALITLPPGMIGEEFRQSRSGRELSFYKRPAGADNAARATPQLDFLDLDSGRVVATLPLIGVRATPPGMTANGEALIPGLAWDVPRDRLYVAHADSDLITVVDLAARTIVRQDAINGGATDPAVEQRTYDVGNTLVKGTEHYRFLTVDTTANRLIISSRTMMVEPLPSGRWRVYDRNEAMRSLDARTLTVQGTLPTNSMLLAATAHGLLVHSVRYLPGGHPSQEPGDFRLRLLDPTDLREIGHWDTTPGDIWRVAISTDERFVYLMRPNATRFSREDGDESFGQGNALGVFDFRGRCLIAERAVPSGTLRPLWGSR